MEDNPLLDGSHVYENDVLCENCGWKGKQKELFIRDMSASLAGQDDPEALAKALADELLRVLYVNSSDFIGKSLVSVGLVPGDKFNKEVEKYKEDNTAYVPCFDIVTRLVRAGVIGAWKGILEEMSVIEKISKEARSSGTRPNFKLREGADV